MNTSRREFLKRSAAAGAAAAFPFVWTSKSGRAQQPDPRPTMAAIGVGGSRGAYSQGRAIAMQASRSARMIAVCEVDDLHAAEFKAQLATGRRGRGRRNRGGDEAGEQATKEATPVVATPINVYRDYRTMLEKEKPSIVTIGTPDHWHVPIAIAAMRAGCDVYCEKPLTLTIEEGFRIRDVVKETGRVFQVGTQQRTDHNQLFLKAIAIVQSGRLGKNVKAHLAIDTSGAGGPFATSTPPDDLDWDMFIGPAQQTAYAPERRKEFRWYYDNSGGQMTDWGAHHIDIAQWALGHANTGPVKVSGTGKFPPIVPEKFDWAAYFAGQATLPNNGFHTAREFHLTLDYADGSQITVHNQYDGGDGRTKFGNGILFTGDEGRIFVDRGRLTGRPVEQLTEADNKELADRIVALYGGEPRSHMRNFFDCVASRKTPISDVASHHRTMTVCHLCNIALMLGRDVKWDPEKEQFIGDEQATALLTRPRREKFSWEATT
jgi:predicted dehydrogenase